MGIDTGWIARKKARRGKDLKDKSLYWKPMVLPWESIGEAERGIRFQLSEKMMSILSNIHQGEVGNVGEYKFSAISLDWFMGIKFGVDSNIIDRDVNIISDAIKQWGQIVIYEV